MNLVSGKLKPIVDEIAWKKDGGIKKMLKITISRKGEKKYGEPPFRNEGRDRKYSSFYRDVGEFYSELMVRG
jgi:hypothetical protein